MAEKSQITEVFTGLPAWAKGAIAVGLLAGTAYVIYKVVLLPKKLKEGKGNRDQENNEAQEYVALQESGKKPTLTKSQMESIANVIFNAVEGYGTDEDSIMRQIRKINNDMDFLGVSRAWGIRPVSSGRFNPEPDFKGNLSGALQNDLSDYWIKLINEHLKKKGSKYRV